MNWADWTFRCSDGTEYAIDAEGNVVLPEGRKIAKGESFTVGPRNAPNLVRTLNGVAIVGEYANISWNSHGYFLDPPSPYVRYRDPQTYLTPVAVAVKIALDGSVN